MLFNSLDFLLFFPIVTMVYFLLSDKVKYLWLLVTSYYFYMCWNAKYALLILLSTVITYAGGLFLEQVKQADYGNDRKAYYKKWIVGFSFGLNLAILFFFKYYNFAADIVDDILGLVGIRMKLPAVDVMLPVGISFYTFQALSYTMDVYRDEIYAEKNFFRYALFVSFFPQLVAGPIERSGNLLKQLAVPKKFNAEKAREGLLLMLWGFFLKIVLADRLAIFVDTVYGNVGEFPGWYLVVATVLFAVQIYCDFAGYSIIAMGSAKILGIDLMENFDAPYLATSVSEFWRRWHISLTSWFKDYLYIPLGGSRKGMCRKYLNKILVFLVSGLWHGASLSFVVWGGLNGVYQVVGEITKPIRDKAAMKMRLNQNSMGHRLLQRLVTFFLIDFSWIFFRASSLEHAVVVIRSILSASNPWVLFDGSLYQCGLDSKNFMVMLTAICVLLFADCCKTRGFSIRNLIAEQDDWFRCLFIAASVCGLLLFGLWGPAFDQANFIYFQF